MFLLYSCSEQADTHHLFLLLSLRVCCLAKPHTVNTTVKHSKTKDKGFALNENWIFIAVQLSIVVVATYWSKGTKKGQTERNKKPHLLRLLLTDVGAPQHGGFDRGEDLQLCADGGNTLAHLWT